MSTAEMEAKWLLDERFPICSSYSLPISQNYKVIVRFAFIRIV